MTHGNARHGKIEEQAESNEACSMLQEKTEQNVEWYDAMDDAEAVCEDS